MNNPKQIYALGRLKTGVMNKTEAEYEQMLKLRQHAGDVLWYEFEPFKLRLADNTFYTPDFIVMPANRELEVHEIKGFWTDDARVKIKVAAAKFHIFRFFAIKKVRKAWEVEAF